MSLLSPEPGLVFWMTIAFLVVVFILAKYAFPVILKSVDKRSDYIEQSLASAKKANEELAKIKDTSNALLADARTKQNDIIKEGTRLKEEIIAQAKSDAEAEAEKMIEIARKQIEEERDKAVRLMKNEAALLSVELAEKLLREKLGTQEEQSNMIKRLLDEIEMTKS